MTMKKLAKEIYLYCRQNHLWGDNIIYFNGKAWSSYDEWSGVQGKEIAPELYEYENRNPRDYIEYSNPDTITMSFEGPLHTALNYGFEFSAYADVEEELQEIFGKYGLYWEQGYSWSLAGYEL